MNIGQIILKCHDLNAVKHFYAQRLGLPIVDLSDKHIELRTGGSVLRFEKYREPCYYHFAFNIPGNRVHEALAWIRERAPVLLDESGSAIIDFPNWNAHSIYFRDPAGNIGEFIARHDLKYHDDRPFSHKQIIEISEIGIPVEDVGKAIDQIRAKCGIPLFWGDRQRFAALGDELGLFIVVDHVDKTWYPTDMPARSFPLAVKSQDCSVYSEKGTLFFP